MFKTNWREGPRVFSHCNERFYFGNQKASSRAQKVLYDIDRDTKSMKNDNDKLNYLVNLTEYLRIVQARIMYVMGYNSEPCSVPEGLIRELRKHGYALETDQYTFLDNFEKFSHNSEPNKFEYSSHIHGSMEADAIAYLGEALHAINWTCLITAESNYAPGRTLKITFVPIEEKEKALGIEIPKNPNAWTNNNNQESLDDYYGKQSIRTLNDLEKAEIEAEEYRTQQVLTYESDDYSF